ncbi:U-box-domain-containing protein [Yamadazyma tenuis]|uniref:RING-type E3 ubiquitin transferase n=1 Tax=Candida tenuis (strain ATCC 10573 / BCRC 21748 / CBS 615 / JCM 9827 / NBRC 10315 / NRRL Y-1498 / VKM Y-70) TaxID=590646 RepID=G3BAD3_CANTC|nr:U-box-domain-containing protein [Yamadazyma tenuis ATCC 10573]EGV62035.1 U-box-domain-containing protein [Yamadazyma tenuis ATCC 10573]WEJ93280.1 U-box-domain-containing protein [Yamadazyma tenuis]
MNHLRSALSSSFLSPSYWEKAQMEIEQNRQLVKGSPATISKYVYKDIQLVKEQIKAYNSQNKAFTRNIVLYKLFKMIEKSNTDSLNALKQKHNYTTNVTYYKQLLQLNKRFLREYDDVLSMMKNDHTNGLLSKAKAKIASSSTASHVYRPLDDVPDDLVDPLSYEVFQDPVVTPGGITYEKAIILDHLDRNGNFDPITRETLKPAQLYPNLAVKNSITSLIGQSS